MSAVKELCACYLKEGALQDKKAVADILLKTAVGSVNERQDRRNTAIDQIPDCNVIYV